MWKIIALKKKRQELVAEYQRMHNAIVAMKSLVKQNNTQGLSSNVVVLRGGLTSAQKNQILMRLNYQADQIREVENQIKKIQQSSTVQFFNFLAKHNYKFIAIISLGMAILWGASQF